jgi:hypothetical protein
LTVSERDLKMTRRCRLAGLALVVAVLLAPSLDIGFGPSMNCVGGIGGVLHAVEASF